ncbi:hypothetical protein [Halococcus sp. AFM35]|uniref:hypothetical protein n=1 Tax=Halococcus sp. AFM35 TaxID=3421653 RepID=UPI003EBAF4F6
MRERIGSRRAKLRLYILLNVNRRLLSLVLAVAMFVILVALGAYAVPTFRQFMEQYAPTRYVFQAYVGALITGVTLVVSISLVVLSQEFGPLGDQRDRMSGSMGFRADVEDIFGSESPPEPNAFLRALVENTTEKAEALEEAADDEDDDFRDAVDELTDDIYDNESVVSDELEDRDFGEYTVVKAALDYNYSWKIHQARRLQNAFGETMNRDTRRKLIDLIDILGFYGPAREHIKTLYFQWQLVDLSRGMLYLSVPSLVTTSALALYLAPSSFPGTFLGIDNLIWIVSAGATAGSVPFLFLTAFILRLVTITKRTLAIGPFILRSEGRSNDIEWK